MKKTIAFLGLISVAFSAGAVDGYKGVKFGSSIAEVSKAHICDFKPYKNDVPGLDSLMCMDFKFSGNNTLASAIFINGKFERFVIRLNTSSDAVIDALKDKYGEISSSSSQEDMNRVTANGGNIFIRFDHDTVIVQGNHDADTKKDTGLLIYTTADYDSKLLAIKSKKLKEDL